MSDLITRIKPLLNAENVAQILDSLGYEVERTYKFALRNERTPSASIRHDGYLKDFGSDWGGDVISLLQEYHNYSFQESIALVGDFLGLQHNYNVDYPEVKPIKITQSSRIVETDLQSLTRIQNDITRWDSVSFRGIDSYKDELLKIAPLWLWKDADKRDIVAFNRNTTFDGTTLVIKIFDYDDRLISYKKRRYKQGKWVTAWNTHPNKQCLNYIQHNGPVFVVEGHHDYLTAILMGINVFATPTVGYKEFNAYEVDLLRGREVVFIPDLGDEGKSVESMVALSTQLLDTRVSFINLEDFFVDAPKEKLDLSEVTEYWTKGLNSLREELYTIARPSL